MATMTSPAAVLAARFARAFNVAMIVIVAGWHVGGAGSELLGHLPDYRSDSFQLAAWLVLAALIAAAAIRLLSARPSRRTAWPLCAAALLTSTIVAAACPPHRMLETDWAWGTAGWIGVLALLRRPLAGLAGFLGAEALATLAVLLHDDPRRLALAGFVTVLFGSAGMQLATAVGARALNVTARQAADAAAREAAAGERQMIADRLYAARRARWLGLRETIEPLLKRLADGAADPGDPGTRQSCAVQAARLRRLLAEGDDPQDPLVHELHASADVAQRRGVAVDIETLGAVPVIPPEARRTITDLVIAALTSATSRARITVNAVDDGVAVSLLADSPADPPPGGKRPGLIVESQRDRQDLWLEARWTGR